MKDDELSVLSSEFKLWGVKFQHQILGSGHIELRWQVTPDKEVRTFVTAKTGSDWRGALNARAVIRRMFRADGLDLKETIKKPKPVLHKALAIPEPVETDACQIKMLRAEVADLTDMVLDLVTTLRDHIQSPVLPPELAALAGRRELVLPVDHDQRGMFEPPPMIRHVPAEPHHLVDEPKLMGRGAKAKASRSVKTIEYVTNNWASTDTIAREMGLKRAVAYMKLYYLKNQGKVEQYEDRWRKKPNGKHNGHHREARP